MLGTYFGTVILRFILPPLIDNFCSKYAFPFESTTCQCGSGASGALKSSERVKTLLPFSVVWVTNPVLAFAPWNGPLLWPSPARMLGAAMASAAKEVRIILCVMYWVVWFFISQADY